MTTKGDTIDYFAPKFDGNNPQQWVPNIQTYLDFRKIPLDERLDIAGRNLEGGASEWYEWMRRNNFLHSWHDFLHKVKICFSSPTSDFAHYQPELSKLTQKGAVAQFQAEFQGIVNNIVTGVSEALLVQFFVNGLQHDLRKQVEAAEPLTLLEAFALAAYYEEMSRAVTRWIELSSWGLPASELVKPKPVGSLPTNRRLTPAEKKEKLSKGLCFNCDKKFNPKNPCKCRG